MARARIRRWLVPSFEHSASTPRLDSDADLALTLRDHFMAAWVVDRVRLAFPSSGFLYIGDIILNLLIVASGIILFMIGVLFLA